MLAKVMVVEDERIVAFNLKQRLAKLGYEVPGIAASGAEALRMAEATRPDLVLMDIRIQGEIDGISDLVRIGLWVLNLYFVDDTADAGQMTDSTFGVFALAHIVDFTF